MIEHATMLIMNIKAKILLLQFFIQYIILLKIVIFGLNPILNE